MPRITRMQRGESNIEVKAGDKEAVGASVPAWHCRSFPSIALIRPKTHSAFPPGRAAQQGRAPPAPRLISRADGGGEAGRSLLQGLNAEACLQVPAPGLEKPASLLLLSSPKEGPSLPGHTPTSPSSLHLPPTKQVLLHTTSARGLTQLPPPAGKAQESPSPAASLLRRC